MKYIPGKQPGDINFDGAEEYQHYLEQQQMNDEQIKLECLRLAHGLDISNGAGGNPTNIIKAAFEFYTFFTSPTKQNTLNFETTKRNND